MIKKLLILLLFASVSFGYNGVKPPLGTQLDYSNPLSKGLVGCWIFTDTPGPLGTAYDLSGNGNHGTLVDDTHSVPGKFGPALSFDGTGDYVNLGEGDGITENMPSLSVSAWAKNSLTSNTQWRFIIGQASVFGIRWMDDETFNVLVYNGTTWGQASSGVYTDTNWHHFVLVYNGTDVRLYIDGVSVDSTPGALTGTTYSTTTNVQIGDYGTGYYWNGSIDNVMIYNRALSAGEISSLYADPFQMFEQPTPQLYVTAAAPPAGTGQVMIIMMSSLPVWLVVILAVSIGLQKRECD